MRSRIEIEADIASLRTRIENAKQRGVSPFKVKQLESQLMSLKGQLAGGIPVDVKVEAKLDTEAKVFDAKRMTATEAEIAEAEEKGVPFVAVDPATKEGDYGAEVTGFQHDGKTFVTDIKIQKKKDALVESAKDLAKKSSKKKSGKSKKRK